LEKKIFAGPQWNNPREKRVGKIFGESPKKRKCALLTIASLSNHYELRENSVTTSALATSVL